LLVLPIWNSPGTSDLADRATRLPLLGLAPKANKPPNPARGSLEWQALEEKLKNSS